MFAAPFFPRSSPLCLAKGFKSWFVWRSRIWKKSGSRRSVGSWRNLFLKGPPLIVVYEERPWYFEIFLRQLPPVFFWCKTRQKYEAWPFFLRFSGQSWIVSFFFSMFFLLFFSQICVKFWGFLKELGFPFAKAKRVPSWEAFFGAASECLGSEKTSCPDIKYWLTWVMSTNQVISVCEILSFKGY